MPAIPQLDVPTGPGIERVNLPANPGMYDRVAAAGERVGGAVEGLGDLAFKIKGVKDDAAVTRSLTQATALKDDFLNVDLKDPKNPKNGDSTTFLPRWQQKLQGFQTAQSKDPDILGLSPEARTEYDTAMDRIARRTSSEVGTAANVFDISKATGVYQTQEATAIKAKDQPAAMAANDYMEAHALRTPEQAAARRVAIPQEIQENDVRDTINGSYMHGAGPVITATELQAKDDKGNYSNWPNLTTMQRESLLNEARYGVRILQMQTNDKYAGYIAHGTPISPDEVHMDMALGALGKSEGLQLLKPERDPDKVNTPQGFTQLWGEIGALKPNDYAGQHAASMAIAQLTGPDKERAEQFFNSKVKPEKDNLSSESMKEVLALNEKLFNEGGYGRFSITIPANPKAAPGAPDEKPQTKFLPEVQQAAALKRADVEAKIFEAVRADPKLLNDPVGLTKLWADTSRASRGHAGMQLFRPRPVVPSAPNGPALNSGTP